MDLIQQLVKNCGVTEVQAKAGSGMIFKVAKKKMSSADFAKVSAVIPGMDSMMRAAPTQEVPLQSTYAIKLVPTILTFVQSKGGDELKDLLEKGIFRPDLDSFKPKV